MRKVVAALFISMDGVVESPEWSMPFFDEDAMTEMQSQLNQQDTVLLGRVSYEEWASYWPTSTDEPFASFINNVPKYVFSTTLDNVNAWQNTTLVKGDAAKFISELKQQPGGDIAVQASPTLVRFLIENALLDELRLSLIPMVIGKGRRLFEGGSHPRRFDLIRQERSKSGITFLNYEAVRK